MQLIRVLIITILTMIAVGSFSQDLNQATVQVVYQFKHQRDTTRKGFFHTEEMGLLVNKTSSLYYSVTAKRQQDKLQAKAAEAQATGSNEINMGVWKSTTNESLYILRKNKELYKLIHYKTNTYLIKEKVPALSWEIGKETKKINNYLCQSATIRYGGRKYVAWFTTDIPLGFGPWKLQGLPGLILEAADDKNEVQFTCIAVNRDGNLGEIKLPENAINTTQQAFDRMREGMKTAGTGSSTDEGMIIAPTLQGSGRPSKSNFNNPLEKPH